MTTNLLEGECALIAGCGGGARCSMARGSGSARSACSSMPRARAGSRATHRSGHLPASRHGRNLPHDSASKANMTMLMKEQARVLAPAGIRVNVIAPGAIPGGGFVAGNLGDLVAQIPLGRPGAPDDIAQMAVAVLSERFGRYVVGTTLEVDGGLGLMSWIPAKA